MDIKTAVTKLETILAAWEKVGATGTLEIKMQGGVVVGLNTTMNEQFTAPTGNGKPHVERR
jgi:hypothetical protein